ncbi:Peroxisomal carnitine O-octanoyltransferase [Tupaia chinensis]|uniref:Peroxisomal carnitine O-octanoyltransferase n=1 Tax=Tupaia chinensis TaxID=246437 RepID=L9JGF3_TUPCH|nr:Peroxisomal carnitine O-octanoyltransferase [Tupaia chinensis]
MENQLAKSTEERTFQYQDFLPSLPVPSLGETLKKYLESVKPFANEEEYKKTEEIVQKFQNGIGEKLQQKLLERAKGKRNWAREYLIGLDPENLTLLEKIQSSLLVFSIEDHSPQVEPEDYSQHSPYDAMVIVNISSYVDNKIIENEGRWKGSEKVRDIPLPEELVFTVDEKILNDISQAEAQFLKEASDLKVVVQPFTSFGKNLTKQKKLHPDTFIQLALQLAYYRLHGRPGCCYETAMTRYFYHGRTETMRSCTVEAVRWCQSMQDPSTSVSTGKGKMHLIRFNCSKGIDRHLLGLFLIAKEEGLPVPELFTDPLFSKSGGGGNFVLSTSLVGYLRFQGLVVPMVHNGYGLFYHIRDDKFFVACTAWKSCPETDAEKLVKLLFHAFHDMIQLTNPAHL